MNWKRLFLALLAVPLLLTVTAASRMERARVLICANAAGGSLYDMEGTLLQVLTFDQKGQAVAGPLAPGTYRVQAGHWSAEFTLRTNASVGQVSGDGWSDGEILHLGGRTLGQLSVRYAGLWQWTLEGETADEAVPLLRRDGDASVCVFSQLPLGAYVLHGPGGDIPLLLTEEDPIQTMDLCPKPTGTTGPLG